MERPKQSEVSKWYLETIKKARLFDYGPVKGTIVLMPYGYAIWELIQKNLDPLIKGLGCQNAYFPLLIPQSFLSKEKEHVEGFSPEMAVVTQAGGSKLEEPLVIRPTSETIMYDSFSKWISSYRDLPLLINQWCNIVRWEKRPFPFLRTTEFLWHEAHTAHAKPEEAEKMVDSALEIYKKFFEEVLAIPVLVGRKTDSEKFAGAVYSASCEALLMDGKALQIATAHNLGQNFSKTFNITYQDKKGKMNNVFQTSWGVSTRAIGGLILTHGDIKGLILPPKIAPVQVVIIPIYKNETGRKKILAFADKIMARIKSVDIRVELDARDQYTPGWKFNEWEIKGAPLRIEIGPNEIRKNELVLVSRLKQEKTALAIDKAIKNLPKILKQIQADLFKRAQDFVKANTRTAENFNQFQEILKNKKGFIKAPWCGNKECEQQIKEKTKATSPCIPFDNKKITGQCVYCGKPAKSAPLWARSY